jgi:hypothetical protein
MKKTVLSLLLAWIAIYASNHLLFKSVPKNSEPGTALRVLDSETREIDSWGPYLPGVRTKADRKPDAVLPPPRQKADTNLSDDERMAENLASSQSSEEHLERSPVPPTPPRKPRSVSPVSADQDRTPDLRSRGPKIVRQKQTKIVMEQKRRIAHGARNTAPRFAAMPDKLWLPNPPPRRWRSGMFMFAPPDF